MRYLLHRGRRFLSMGILVGAGLLGAQAAHAGFVMTVVESGGPLIPIFDDGPLDVDTIDPGIINVNTAALNVLLGNYQFTTLGSTSNRRSGAPLSGDPAFLSQTGAVQRITTAGNSSITIKAYDTDFLFPSGTQMTTAASDTFTFMESGSSRTFQSGFDPGNFDPPGAGIPSPLLAFVPPTGIGPFSTSNPGVVTPLGTQTVPYGLNNTTVITLGPKATTAKPTDQFTGSTTVTGAVAPEPGSGLLMLVGGGALALRRRRRK
jgi:hypothetical protein